MPSNLCNFSCNVPDNPFCTDGLQFADPEDETIYQESSKEIYQSIVYYTLGESKLKVLIIDNTSHFNDRNAFDCLDLVEETKGTGDSQITNWDTKTTLAQNFNSSYQVNKQFVFRFQENRKEINEQIVDYTLGEVELSKVLNKDEKRHFEDGDLFDCLKSDEEMKGTGDCQMNNSDTKPNLAQFSNSSIQVNKPVEQFTFTSATQQKKGRETERTTFYHVRNVDMALSLTRLNQEENARGKKAKKEINKKSNVQKVQEEKCLQVQVDAQNVTKKWDQRKNMYGHSFKHIIRELFTKEYKEFLTRICIKHGVSDPQDIVSFYREKLLWSISLSNVLTLLDYEAHPVDSTEHKVIKAFHAFYVWYMRKRYILHIMNSTEIEHKEEYIEATRSLIYLPRIRKPNLKNATHSTSEF